MLDRLGRDVRYASRQLLLRSPVSTTVAVVSLAVGITVAVTAFSTVNALVFRPLPVPDADRVVHVFASNPVEFLPDERLYGPSSYVDVPDYAATGLFAGLVAWRSTSVTVIVGDVAPARLPVTFVSPGFFDVLGIDMARGRRPADEQAFEIVITDQYRRRTFGADAPAIGATVNVNGTDFTIIGVAPAAFRGLDRRSTTMGWVPARTLSYVDAEASALLTMRDRRSWQVAGRLAPGVTRDIAATRLAGTARALEGAYPESWRTVRGTARQITVLTQLQRALADSWVAELLAVLSVAVGIVVLLACTNVAGLLLAQSLTRRHEIAVRLALGASRRQLTAQLLTESVLLALLGGTVGLLASRGVVGLMARNPYFDALDLTLDWRVLAATIGLCFVCALLFGITPMGQSLRVDVKSGLTGQGVTSERGGVRGRLIALQVCLSCMLLVLGVHASRGVLSLASTTPGFETDGLLVAELDMNQQAMDSVARRQYLEHAITTMRALPGVMRTGLASRLPTIERRYGTPVTTPVGYVTAGLQWVDEDYFHTLGQPLLAGSIPRDLPPAAERRYFGVVNRAFAERLGGQPIGTTVERMETTYTIVAIVDDRGGDERQVELPVLYTVMPRFSYDAILVARAERGASPAVMAQFMSAVRDRYPALVPPGVNTLSAQLDEFYTPQRYIGNTALAIAAMQLGLAALGLYSLLLYATLARTREIGVRMALGALPRRASMTVIKDGLHYVLAGTALGILLGVPAALFASNNFIGGDATDPIPFVAALIGIAASTAAAAYIPARRAARVQPMTALRME